MQWYNGGIAEAVSLSKSKGAVFVVYIEGQDDESKQITGLIETEEITNKLNRDNFVAIRLAANSIAHQQFSELYKQTAVPSIYFIGKSGLPLKIITDVSDSKTFINELDDILSKAGLNKPKDSAFTISTNLINVEQQGTLSTASANVVCEGDVCFVRNGTVSTNTNNDVAATEVANAAAAVDAEYTERVERAKKLLEAKKLEKKREEVENEKKKELERRKLGQDVQQLQKWQQDNELKQMKEELVREKKLEKEARERILAQIAQDKADRALKFQPTASSTPTLKDTTQASPHQQIPSSKSDSNTARLQFKLPDGAVHTQDFPSTDKFISVVNFIKSNLNLPYNDFVMSTTFPRKQFTENDYTTTLIDLKLIPTAVILILPLNKGSVTTNSGPGGFAGFIWSLLTPIFGILNFIKSFLGFGDGGGGGASGDNTNVAEGFSQQNRFNGVIHIRNKYDLENRLKSAYSNLVVIDFFATWCGPCKMIASDVESLAREYPNVVFLKVDVDENGDISQQYRVSAMPTFVFLKNGREVSRFKGADTYQLRSTVQRYR